MHCLNTKSKCKVSVEIKIYKIPCCTAFRVINKKV